MKKNKMLVLAMVMTLALVGCSTKEVKNKDSVIQEEVAGDKKQEEAGESQVEENIEDTENPDESNSVDTDKEGVSHTQKLEEIEQAVAAAYGENYVPSMILDETYVAEVLKVQSDWYDAIIAKGPMMSAHVDTFVAIHPTEGYLENVVKGLESYKDYLVNDTLQYPSNLLKVKVASIEVIDDYVYFIMLGFIDNNITEDAEVLEAFEAQNEIALEVIRNHK